MDIETARTLQSLREQNLTLFDKLHSNQNSFRHMLHSLRNSRNPTEFGSIGSSQRYNVNVEKKQEKPLRSGGDTADKIHLYRKIYQEPNLDQSSDSDLTMVSDLNTTSTPIRQVSHGVRDTPKSILKGRKIIEDNVRVDSQFEHTPSHNSAASRRHLNFSYNEMDDIDMLKKVIRNQLEIDMVVEDDGRMRLNRRRADQDKDDKMTALRQLQVEEEKLRSREMEEERDLMKRWKGSNQEVERLRGKRDDEAETSLDSLGSHASSREAESVEELVDRRLLTDSGNDRQRSAIIRELSKRPKSVVFDINAPQGREDFTSSRISSMNQSSTRSALRSSDAPNGPLLGYDFIAGLLDNESKLVDRSDAFYDELSEFRRVNKDECTGKRALSDVIDLTRPISPEIMDPGHTCIHGYNINERLYPEPLNENDEGVSVCPVCLSSRKEPTQDAPAFVRVSIPRSSLQAPYKIKPHRRRSFDDTDNVALSKHCLAGWECSKPSMIPTASTVDLKHYADGLKSQLTTTVQDIENMTAAYKILPRADPVLDTSRSLRADVQYYAMDRSLHPLRTSAY